MTQSALNKSASKALELFNKEDWASSYCNVEKELSNIELKIVSGEVPRELSGVFYRNGPGRLERNGQWVHHPFDGDGMVVSMQFENGEVRFSNRFVRTKEWEEEEKAGKFLYRGVFGTQKRGGLLANAFDLRLKNIANTNVVKLGNELLALWEASSPYALNPQTLETYGISNLKGVLEPGEAFSAHPRFDPGHYGASRMVTFGVNTGPKSTIRLMEFDNDGKLISERKDRFDGFAFLHDFAITPNWSLFLQNAISFNPLPFLIGQRSAAQCLTSNPGKQSKLWLIPREGGSYSGQSPRILNAPEGFVFHHLNAWEEGSEIILESIYYKDFPSIKPNEDFRQISFENIPEGILKRCRFNLDTQNIKIKTLSNQCCEFAMVNPNFQGIRAEYSWMATAENEIGNAPLQAIKKLNLSNGKKYSWSAFPRGFVSEPLMIPSRTSNSEDDGWIVVLVWNSERVASDLVILKANTLDEQARLELPIGIPHGLHGSWAG